MVMADAKVFLAYNMRCPFHHRAPRLSTPSPTTRRPNTRSLNYKIRPSSYGSGCTLHDNTAPMSPMDTFVLSACPLSSPSARNRMSMPSCAPPLSLSPHIPPSLSFHLHVSTRVFAYGTFTRAPPRAPPAARRTTSSRRRVGCRCSPADAFGCRGSA